MKRVEDFLLSGKDFLIISHKGPDGDAVGAMLGLGLAIEQSGKKVTFYNADPIPLHLNFLPFVHRVVNSLDKFTGEIVVALDSADMERLGEEFQKFYAKNKKILLNIDHHATNTKFGDAFLIEPNFSSTCEVLFDLIKSFKWNITPEIATSLFCGIVADTGSFKYRNTTSKVLRTAAELVDLGAHPELIGQKLFDTYPASRILLLKMVLQSIRFDFQNRVVSIVVREKDLAQSGASIDASEGFVEILRGIEGVQVSILAKEQKDGNIKISARSKENIDIASVTQKFGGGGHRVAAGATLPGPADDALNKFINEVGKHLK